MTALRTAGKARKINKYRAKCRRGRTGLWLWHAATRQKTTHSCTPTTDLVGCGGRRGTAPDDGHVMREARQKYIHPKAETLASSPRAAAVPPCSPRGLLSIRRHRAVCSDHRLFDWLDAYIFRDVCGCRGSRGGSRSPAHLANWGDRNLGAKRRRLNYRDERLLANGGILRSAIGHSVKALAACHGSPNVAIRSIPHTNSTRFSSIFGSRRP